MKEILIIIGITTSIIAGAQTKEQIDSLINEITPRLNQYKCIVYSDERVLKEDARVYDTAYYYYNSGDGKLIYVEWKVRTHTFHITGDNIDVTELFLINGKVVFKRDYGYSFLNPQWHLEQSLNETMVSVVESSREYFTENGSPLMEYKSRSVVGKYKDRLMLLNSIPLEEKFRRRWSSRCDECIEAGYLSKYRELIQEMKN